eukprot:TRINITY_DN1026_c2_g1_i1.p1 TRINITY_DN1026_c2_g1~~TRINITY_DN1026_c2_g1_i1.p1  ORF type:complete len:421 (-),score=110.06 TRINITY_DN1026_c2_g1_i1:1076-2308(-)
MERSSVFFYAVSAGLDLEDEEDCQSGSAEKDTEKGKEKKIIPLSPSDVKERLEVAVSLAEHLKEDEIRCYVDSVEKGKISLARDLEKVAKERQKSGCEPTSNWDSMRSVALGELGSMPEIFCGSVIGKFHNLSPPVARKIETELEQERGVLLAAALSSSEKFEGRPATLPITSSCADSLLTGNESRPKIHPKAALDSPAYIGCCMCPAMDEKMGRYHAKVLASGVQRFFSEAVGRYPLVRVLYICRRGLKLDEVLSEDESEWSFIVEKKVHQILGSWGFVREDKGKRVWRAPTEGGKKGAFVIFAWDPDVFDQACHSVDVLLARECKEVVFYTELIGVGDEDNHGSVFVPSKPKEEQQCLLFDYLMALPDHWREEELVFLESIRDRDDILSAWIDEDKLPRTVVLEYDMR